MFLPVVPPSGRPPLLLVTWEVHHRSNPSSFLVLYLRKSSLERKLLIFANALKCGLPSLILFPYQPSVIGIVLGLACPVPSHCYNAHPESSAHHLKLCQCQSFVPALPDSLAKIYWHRARGYDLYIQHVDTQLNPISNSGKSLHP